MSDSNFDHLLKSYDVLWLEISSNDELKGMVKMLMFVLGVLLSSGAPQTP